MKNTRQTLKACRRIILDKIQYYGELIPPQACHRKEPRSPLQSECLPPATHSQSWLWKFSSQISPKWLAAVTLLAAAVTWPAAAAFVCSKSCRPLPLFIINFVVHMSSKQCPWHQTYHYHHSGKHSLVTISLNCHIKTSSGWNVSSAICSGTRGWPIQSALKRNEQLRHTGVLTSQHSD